MTAEIPINPFWLFCANETKGFGFYQCWESPVLQWNENWNERIFKSVWWWMFWTLPLPAKCCYEKNRLNEQLYLTLVFVLSAGISDRGFCVFIFTHNFFKERTWLWLRHRARLTSEDFPICWISAFCMQKNRFKGWILTTSAWGCLDIVWRKMASRWNCALGFFRHYGLRLLVLDAVSQVIFSVNLSSDLNFANNISFYWCG